MKYKDQEGIELFISSGISKGDAWGTFYKKPSGTLKRVKSKYLPMCLFKQDAQADLDRYAIRKELKGLKGLKGVKTI